MTKFNPESKELLTYGEALNPAMEITDQNDADQYLRDYITYLEGWLKKEPRGDNMTAEEIAKTNLGYYAGYYDNETRRRVEKIFMCAHPIFGKIENHVPTNEEAFNLGLKFNSSTEKVKAK
jgi:hypothetical protein